MPAQKRHSPAGDLLERVTALLGIGPIIGAVVLACWELLVHALQVRSSALPSPSRILLEIWREAPQLWKHALVTGFESLEGLLPAVLVGGALAGLMARSTRACRIAGPALSFLRVLPLIVLAPLMIAWFGYGAAPAAATAFLVSFLPLVLNLRAGFESVPVEMLEILSAMGASPARTLLKARLPACLPFFTNALKLAVPLACAGAAVAEFIGSDQGLGYLMHIAGSKADATPFFAALAAFVLMVLCPYCALLILEQTCVSWPAAVAAGGEPASRPRFMGSPPDRAT